jgi:CubicO group peptidase (beta-lactamase class C family)
MAEVQGTYDDRFKGVADQVAINMEAGKDVGCCVSVVHDGRTVVDVWSGAIDDQGTPWAEDTIINVWSSTKTMCNLSALVLADRGELDIYAPVSRYWPEFAANGKEEVATRHFLSHSAGLSGWQEPLLEEDLYDWEKCTALLAAQAPWWEPGTASGYHALTHGYLVGEVIRRVLDGTTVGERRLPHRHGPRPRRSRRPRHPAQRRRPRRRRRRRRCGGHPAAHAAEPCAQGGLVLEGGVATR